MPSGREWCARGVTLGVHCMCESLSAFKRVFRIPYVMTVMRAFSIATLQDIDYRTVFYYLIIAKSAPSLS